MTIYVISRDWAGPSAHPPDHLFYLDPKDTAYRWVLAWVGPRAWFLPPNSSVLRVAAPQGGHCPGRVAAVAAAGRPILHPGWVSRYQLLDVPGLGRK